MAAGSIVKVWRDATHARAAVAVDEGGSAGRVEYTGAVPLEVFEPLTSAEKKAALVAAVKAVRDAQLSGAAEIPGIAGSVTI